MRDLFNKNLIQINRLTQLEREATRLEGERGLLVATTAQAKGKINELELQIIQIDQELSSEVAKEMREIDGKIGEFVERKVTAEDQLRRIDIRSPQDGTVFQSNVHTVGGVISAGDAIMLIVPAADNLTVEAKVNPQDINQLQVGQKATLRFTSFNQQSTPEIDGTVSRISADITTDQRTGIGYYTIRIAHERGGGGPSRRGQAGARHAGRGLRSDRRPHGHFLPDEAADRPLPARLPREIARRAGTCHRPAVAPNIKQQIEPPQ